MSSTSDFPKLIKCRILLPHIFHEHSHSQNKRLQPLHVAGATFPLSPGSKLVKRRDGVSSLPH
jgi:hypothetical protein